MIRVILCGVGGVARGIVRLSQQRPSVEVVAAYSRNPKLIGLDLGDVAGTRRSGVVVSDRVRALATRADVLIIGTSSFLSEVVDDINFGIDAGLNVVCTAEEMAFSWGVDGAIAEALDQRARAAQVSVVGAGANPGYIYEVVALALTGAMWRVDQISVRRVVDLSRFSATVLERLGIGFGPSDFETMASRASITGHLGFAHTMRSFARKLGERIEHIEERIEPIPARGSIASVARPVNLGTSAGIRQTATAFVSGRRWFEANFIGHVDLSSEGWSAEDVFDLSGLPEVHVTVQPGFDPQWTTSAVLANILPLVVHAPPGLISVTDLPMPTPWR